MVAAPYYKGLKGRIYGSPGLVYLRLGSHCIAHLIYGPRAVAF